MTDMQRWLSVFHTYGIMKRILMFSFQGFNIPEVNLASFALICGCHSSARARPVTYC